MLDFRSPWFRTPHDRAVEALEDRMKRRRKHPTAKQRETDAFWAEGRKCAEFERQRREALAEFQAMREADGY